jgi:hypothetical protein
MGTWWRGEKEIRRKDPSNLLTRPTDEKRLCVTGVKSHPAPPVINLPTTAGEDKSTEEMREVIK